MSADEQARVYHAAAAYYDGILINPDADLAEVLTVANLTLSCCRDYLLALETEVLQSMPFWSRTLVKIVGARRLLATISHYERTMRFLRGRAMSDNAWLRGSNYPPLRDLMTERDALAARVETLEAESAARLKSYEAASSEADRFASRVETLEAALRHRHEYECACEHPGQAGHCVSTDYAAMAGSDD